VPGGRRDSSLVRSVTEMRDRATLYKCPSRRLAQEANGRASRRFRVHDFLMNDKFYSTAVELPAGRRYLRGVSCLSEGQHFSCLSCSKCMGYTVMPVIEILFHYHSRFCINRTMGSSLTVSVLVLPIARVSEIPFMITVIA
jgi:hypothetical protein